MIQVVWVIPALPLAAFLVCGLFGRRWLGHWSGVVASAAVGLATVIAVGIFFEVLAGQTRTGGTLYSWIAVGDFTVNLSALADPLSSWMLLVLTIVSILIFVYSNG